MIPVPAGAGPLPIEPRVLANGLVVDQWGSVRSLQAADGMRPTVSDEIASRSTQLWPVLQCHL